ncbi:hypothetical protein E3P77_00710 [Wallemia ichthyophaga]|uniref:DUF1748-domain-containing protein n=1 Tax=Wallemia ichthyophaga (strain EXF-994 / CBS 113033) TaxID=1299270 RepID=R9AID1_WALI9|nr:uncharacterized protein J056_003653 [Wallemia ichthyophaga EXF-994]EOR01977.1 hypothetical protein J056_003653 [Wallemia ichthyophaga EXF-994]TIB69144.1 hypothetical protein E3P77_00710 [Wallemia ichthyophaga]
MLARLTHYGIDAVLLSTVLAGVKRSTGFSPDIEKFTEEETAKSIAKKYLGIGEFCYDGVTGYVVNSSYFKRGERR